VAKEEKVKLETSFEVCPNCGYKGGFHILLYRDSPDSSEAKMKLKCPNCGYVYDLELYCAVKDE